MCYYYLHNGMRMTPFFSFQMATLNWIVTCRCETPAEYNCNTCGEKLCSNCKQKHLQNNDTRHHSITEYAKKLMPGIVSSPPCHDHDEKECICWCQTCKKAVCVDCVTSNHNGHKFTKLETILQKKRSSLQEKLENLESNSLKEWRDVLSEAREVTSDFLGQVNRIEEVLEERAEEFHKRVEEIKENTKKQLNELKTSNLAILHEQEKTALDGLEKVKQEIKECEDRLRSGDMESLLEHEDIQDSKKDILPIVSSVFSLVFSPSQIDTKSLTEMFGKLNVLHTYTTQGAEGTSQPSILTSHKLQKPSVTEMVKKPSEQETNQSTTQGDDKPIQATSRDPQKSSYEYVAATRYSTHLIPEPSVQSEFQTGSYPIVACTGSGHAWVKRGARKLQLMDQHGSVKETINTDFGFHNMVLSPRGDILLADTDNKCVKLVTADKMVKTLFKPQWTPDGMCFLRSGDIVVTFLGRGRVVIYDLSGKVVRELNEKLFTHPYRIAQSKVNSDLYISDDGKVLALDLDKDYQVRFEYAASFSPLSLCADNIGHVLVTDKSNERVDILDNNGQLLQYLLTGTGYQKLTKPVCIDVDNDGNAWVGEHWAVVKVVKYLK